MTTTAEIDAIVEGQTVPKLFLRTLAEHSELVALRWKDDDDAWHEMTFAEFGDKVARAAAGLRAIGIGAGDRVLLMIRNRPEFHVLDTATLFLGATAVSIYNSSSPEQIEYLANDAAAKMAIAEDRGFYESIAKVGPSIPSLATIAVIDEADLGDVSYAELIANEPVDLAQEAETVQPSDMATLIYTSGTTGPSKGVMIDHYNVCWTLESLRQAFDIDDLAGKRLVSYLPMAHIAERMVSHYESLAFGVEVTCCPDPTLFAAYAGEVHPHVMFGVPRVWEKIYGGIQAALAADPEKEKAVGEAVVAAGPISEKMTWGTATPEEIETYEFLDAVAFSTIRGLVGLDQLLVAITGAAPIPAELLAWFRTIGVPLSEIYGLSETTGPMTWAAYKVKPGYVGVACPGVEVKLAEDGEVLCRGGNVFQGYLNQPEQTAEVLVDGWFHSGDIGEIDDDGYVKIVDRKKELIVTAGGKNLSPANLEAALKTIPLVGQAIAIGDRRPFVSALVVLDPDIAPQWAANNDIEFTSLEDLAKNPVVVSEIESDLTGVMAGFNNAERVKKVKIMGEEWMPDSELLTPTSKLKRRGIHAHFEAEIEALYS
ncbi:MAG: long-chain fatty acid--CoA ligase [Actinomycetia bacterium]|nr:long-chain fatty acid--CoA ligase [Actinomycetes bacterium]MCP5033316.1 long-chain fatty acid--CoA ligase [Actinomycetes bacterium]